MTGDKLPLGRVSSPAPSILAPPPAQAPPPSYEESSNARLPPAYVGPSRRQRPSVHNEPPVTINSHSGGGRFTLSQPAEPYPPWVKRNLTTAKITVFLMIIVAIIHLVFAGVVAKDIRDDDFDDRCAYNYIFAANDPPNGERWTPSSVGQYHSDCRLLFRWSQLLTAAASITAIRALLQAVPVQKPSAVSFQYSHGGVVDSFSFTSPSRVYALRTIFSFTICVLYLASAIILCTNRFITGPPATDSYRTIYLGCLAVIWLSVVVTAQQATTTGIASWFLKGGKQMPRKPSASPSPC